MSLILATFVLAVVVLAIVAWARARRAKCHDITHGLARAMVAGVPPLFALDTRLALADGCLHDAGQLADDESRRQALAGSSGDGSSSASGGGGDGGGGGCGGGGCGGS